MPEKENPSDTTQPAETEPTDTVAGVHVDDATGVDADGNTIDIKSGDEAIISKADILIDENGHPVKPSDTTETTVA